MSAAAVATVSELARAWEIRPEDTLTVAELKAGSEDAYARLIARYHRPIYGLVYRILDDPTDAPDTTQEIFLKVFRGMSKFNGESGLKTWMYRIAINEARNRRRWFFRHKVREHSIEPLPDDLECRPFGPFDSLVDSAESPFECVARGQVRARLEQALQELPEDYRTAVVLRDIEDLSYREIAEVMETPLGTVKSRVVRGREALRKWLLRHAHELNPKTEICEVKRQISKLTPESREAEVAL